MVDFINISIAINAVLAIGVRCAVLAPFPTKHVLIEDRGEEEEDQEDQENFHKIIIACESLVIFLNSNKINQKSKGAG